MFQKGLALKQKKIQSKIIDFLSFHHSSLLISGTTVSHTESTTQITPDSNTKKSRSVTLSSVLLAKRFSSSLLAPVNRNNITVTNLNNANETAIATKKQHNPRRHVFSTAGANENQNPVQSATTTASGEKVKILFFIFNNFIMKMFRELIQLINLRKQILKDLNNQQQL